MTRSLSDVRHVPALKNNLISLGTLVASECVIQAEDGVTKVKKRSMVILSGRKSQNNLYRLKENMVIGGAAVSTQQKVTSSYCGI